MIKHKRPGGPHRVAGQTTTVQTFRLTAAERRAVQAEAKRRGITVSALLRLAIVKSA